MLSSHYYIHVHVYRINMYIPYQHAHKNIARDTHGAFPCSVHSTLISFIPRIVSGRVEVLNPGHYIELIFKVLWWASGTVCDKHEISSNGAGTILVHMGPEWEPRNYMYEC